MFVGNGVELFLKTVKLIKFCEVRHKKYLTGSENSTNLSTNDAKITQISVYDSQ